MNQAHVDRCNAQLDASWKRYYTPQTRRDFEMLKRFDYIVSHVVRAPILDIGCAEGLTCHLLAERGFNPITGIDISDKVIARARELLKNDDVQLYRAWAEQLSFPDESFATVVMTETLEHVLDATKAANEADRVLRKGGRLVVSVPFKGKTSELHLRTFPLESSVTGLFPSSYRWHKFRVIEHPPKPKAWLVGCCDKV